MSISSSEATTEDLKKCHAVVKKEIEDIVAYARQVKDLDDKLTGGAGRIQEDSVVSLLSHAEAALQRVEQKRIQVDMLLARLKDRQRSLEDHVREQAKRVDEIKKSTWQSQSDEPDADRDDLYVNCQKLLDKIHNPETGLKGQVRQVTDQLNTGERRLRVVQEKMRRNTEDMRGVVSFLRKLRAMAKGEREMVLEEKQEGNP